MIWMIGRKMVVVISTLMVGLPIMLRKLYEARLSELTPLTMVYLAMGPSMTRVLMIESRISTSGTSGSGVHSSSSSFLSYTHTHTHTWFEMNANAGLVGSFVRLTGAYLLGQLALLGRTVALAKYEPQDPHEQEGFDQQMIHRRILHIVGYNVEHVVLSCLSLSLARSSYPASSSLKSLKSLFFYLQMNFETKIEN